MNKLKNKIALVTGSSRGIGKSIAMDLAKEGAFILIQYANDKASAEKILNEIKTIGGNGEIVKADFSKRNL